jgi:hypothetical protein
LLVLTLVEGLIGFSQMSDRISFYKSTLQWSEDKHCPA